MASNRLYYHQEGGLKFASIPPFNSRNTALVREKFKDLAIGDLFLMKVRAIGKKKVDALGEALKLTEKSAFFFPTIEKIKVKDGELVVPLKGEITSRVCELNVKGVKKNETLNTARDAAADKTYEKNRARLAKIEEKAEAKARKAATKTIGKATQNGKKVGKVVKVKVQKKGKQKEAAVTNSSFPFPTSETARPAAGSQNAGTAPPASVA